MEEGLAKVPKLELAQYKYVLSREATSANPSKSGNESVREKLMAGIIVDNMAPFYQECCKDLGWPVDGGLLAKMKAANEERLKELEGKVEDAEKNLGETEIREAHLAKAEYLSLIGSRDLALEQFRRTYEKTVTLGHRLDLVFHQVRIGFFGQDFDLISRNLDKAKALIEEGGDWDRRNRLKVCGFVRVVF